MSNLIYYVAGNFAEYKEYRSRKEKQGVDTSNWRYVSTPVDLRGLSQIKGFYIGSFEDRKDIEEIRQIIDMIKGTQNDN